MTANCTSRINYLVLDHVCVLFVALCHLQNHICFISAVHQIEFFALIYIKKIIGLLQRYLLVFKLAFVYLEYSLCSPLEKKW